MNHFRSPTVCTSGIDTPRGMSQNDSRRLRRGAGVTDRLKVGQGTDRRLRFLERSGMGGRMDKANLLHTHSWEERNPHQFKQAGKPILLLQCSRCSRDFALGLDGSGWRPVYVGIFKVELLATECPSNSLMRDGLSVLEPPSTLQLWSLNAIGTQTDGLIWRDDAVWAG